MKTVPKDQRARRILIFIHQETHEVLSESFEGTWDQAQQYGASLLSESDPGWTMQLSADTFSPSTLEELSAMLRKASRAIGKANSEPSSQA